MELSVNSGKKKSLRKIITESNKIVHVIMMISKILLFVGIVGGGAYILLNFILPDASMVRVNGVLQKDVGWIVISSSFIIAPCLILSLCLNTLAKNIAGSNNSSRVDESLLIANNYLRYSFRVKHQSTSSERRVVRIDFSKIKTVRVDEKTENIEFTGDFVSEYFDDYRNKKPVDVAKIDKFIICDYFSPSLKEILISNNVM